MNRSIDNIALFDMDGTLCDYDEAMFRELELLKSINEKSFHPPIRNNAPRHVRERLRTIMMNKEWWANLPKFKLGWDILEEAKLLNYHIMILTKCSKSNPDGWAGKIEWVKKYLPGTDITITTEKSLVYGKVLVDDYPPYIQRWLEHRPRGLVIMPANRGNKDFRHSQAIRYDGSNLVEVKEALRLRLQK